MWWFATCDVMWPCCPVLLHYYKVLRQYHSVLQSSTPVLQSARPVLQSTTPENTKHHHKHTNQKLKNTTTNTPSTFYARHLLHQTPCTPNTLAYVPLPTPLQLSRSSPQRHATTVGGILSKVCKMSPCRQHFKSVEAVRKDIQPEETFTFRSPTLNKHNHCSPQRHTIFLFDFLSSSCPQSAKTYTTWRNIYFQISYT